MRGSWVNEFWNLVLLLAPGLVIGHFAGYPVHGLLVACILFIGRLLFKLQRLADWSLDPRPDNIPVEFGIWGEIHARFARMSARHAEREQRLTSLLEQFQLSAAALPDAAIILGAAGNIGWFNDAAGHYFDLDAERDLGQPLVNLFRVPELARFLAERSYSNTLELTDPGDRRGRHFELRLVPLDDGRQMLLARDITERIRDERVRRDFVANVSHELRTPLTVVNGFIENLRYEGSDCAERWSRPLELMSSQAARMLQIVEDLLLLARLESGDGHGTAGELDVASLLRTVAQDAAALAPDGPKVRVRIDSPRRILGDEGQIRSAVTNLVQNALRHTPAAGQVTIGWSDAGDTSCLVVEDNGEGIAREHLARITERFYRVDAGRSRQAGGTGLGLAIVKHVLQRHGATLEISSEQGSGSTFRCRFPGAALCQPESDIVAS